MNVGDEIRKIDETIRELEARRGALNKLPVEPAVGSVVTFKRTLSRKSYSYAALRTSAGWFTTGGNSSVPLTWMKLVKFAEGARINRNTGWVNVVPGADYRPTRRDPWISAIELGADF